MGVPGVVGGGVVESAGDFADRLAADWQQGGRDVDPEGEVEPLKPLNLDEPASALPELLHQEMKWTMALQLQHPEWFLHFESTQEQMVLVLLALQVL